MALDSSPLEDASAGRARNLRLRMIRPSNIERAFAFADLSKYSFKDRLLMRAGCPAAFTVDGPKGPRYIAKMGPVLLAKKTGNPMLPFTITPKKFWQMTSSWDRTQVPKAFTRARVLIAAPIFVPGDADED